MCVYKMPVLLPGCQQLLRGYASRNLLHKVDPSRFSSSYRWSARQIGSLLNRKARMWVRICTLHDNICLSKHWRSRTHSVSRIEHEFILSHPVNTSTYSATTYICVCLKMPLPTAQNASHLFVSLFFNVSVRRDCRAQFSKGPLRVVPPDMISRVKTERDQPHPGTQVKVWML